MLLHPWLRAALLAGLGLAAAIGGWVTGHRLRADTPEAFASASVSASVSEAERVCRRVLAQLTVDRPAAQSVTPHHPANTLTANPSRSPLAAAPGITLYRTVLLDRPLDSAPETTTLIYELDLSQGAHIDLAGTIAPDPQEINPAEPHRTAAYDTGRDPPTPPRSLAEHWQTLATAQPDRAFAVLNGQFFGAHPLRLAFPVKAQGEIISGGYAGAGEYEGEKMMLAIANATATIAAFPEVGYPDNPLFSDIPDLIVGLHPCADKGRDRVVGRTFAGVADRDGDGQTETVLFLVASHATPTDALRVLHHFGAIAAMMLDGGGSTQTLALGQVYLASSDRRPRPFPQAIGLLSGERSRANPQTDG